MFMSNSHTPSNILFSKALTDTYVDLMKIAYSGWCLYWAQRINQRYNGAVAGGVGRDGFMWQRIRRPQ
jgi:hypothetical protein